MANAGTQIFPPLAPPSMGGFGDTGPAPLMECPAMPLWKVELQVVGFIWCHDWCGYARNSIDAVEQARRNFYGALYGDREVMARYALTVRGVFQQGV
jgi:hypothetical protein